MITWYSRTSISCPSGCILSGLYQGRNPGSSITSNNDGVNDYLVFQNLDFFPGTGLKVYNRWGKKIYESADYKNDWDGGGHSDGTYYFILEGDRKSTRLNSSH